MTAVICTGNGLVGRATKGNDKGCVFINEAMGGTASVVSVDEDDDEADVATAAAAAGVTEAAVAETGGVFLLALVGFLKALNEDTVLELHVVVLDVVFELRPPPRLFWV